MIEVLRAGMMTTVQDWPGRLGMWAVGVPPSGPMDDRSFRLGNGLLGNPEGAPGLECTLAGPKLRVLEPVRFSVTGADSSVTLDGEPVQHRLDLEAPEGAVIDVGKADGRGLRVYLLFAGGVACEEYLGSAATFTLGRFGGRHGRALKKGDVLELGPPVGGAVGDVPDLGRSLAAEGDVPAPGGATTEEPPELTHDWKLAVMEGPHAAPEFFTREDVEEFYATAWEVHFNSARTGVRLVGPRPRWAREDGGEAGLHPSNIHDTPYSVGSVDYTGDTPVLLGPDGPSLGGFVCPATIVKPERWKLGQLRPGDRVRFARTGPRDDGILHRRGTSGEAPSVTYRRSGDDNLLIEYGPMVLDLALRMRVHALAERLAADGVAGITDLTPGIRSLQLKLDPDVLSVSGALEMTRALEDELPATRELSVPSRTVHLPLSWDDPSTREAIARYMSGVRDDAPWCPWNIEFIRRVNGLDSVDDVHRTVFDAEYLVLGLGDVYLGAPVATPLDPRQRLVTTKYNPARTWTPENAVGIGGAYLCIYGMEGPGGYQFVGRTVQVWSRSPGASPPWLLRFFDRIRWHPVEADELVEQRALMAEGRLELEIEERTFRLSDHLAFLDREADSIAAFQARQQAAFGVERAAWAAAGEFEISPPDQAAA